MTAPTKQPLLPKVTLTKNDASTYTFDPFADSKAFIVRSLRCTPAFDATGGEFGLTLTSTDASNSATNDILDNIEEGNEVLIAVGKSTPTNIFRGVIESLEVSMPNKNFMDVILKGPDWGSDILKNRVVNGKWVQAKQADGITLDNTDNNVLVEQIAKDLLNQTSSYPSADITAAAQGIVVSNSNFTSSNIRLAQFYAQYEYLDDKLSELDGIAGTIHYVDPAKNFIMKFPGDNIGPSSNFLLTDDEDDTEADDWAEGRVGYIAPGASVNNSLEHHRRRYYGLGGDNVTLDQLSETNSSSDPTFSAGNVQWLAGRIGPFTASANIEKIGLLLSKQGSPTSDLYVEIIEDNQGTTTNSKPLGQTLIRVSKPAAAISSSASWHYFPIVQPINALQKYWIVIEGNGDASNYFKWHKDAGSSGVKSISTNGTSWTTTTSTTTYAYRQYYSSPLLSIYPGVGASASDKHFHESVVKRPDITEQAHMLALLVQEAQTGLKRKQVFRGKVYAPDEILQTGQGVRVRIQQAGYQVDGNFIIGQLEYVWDSSDDLSTGTYYYDIQAARFIDFS